MIQILFVYLGLLVVILGRRLFAALGRFDRAALAAFLLLGAATRPGVGHHTTEIANAITGERPTTGLMQSTAARAAAADAFVQRLEFHDYGVVTVTTRDRAVVGVGLYGRVFVALPRGT